MKFKAPEERRKAGSITSMFQLDCRGVASRIQNRGANIIPPVPKVNLCIATEESLLHECSTLHLITQKQFDIVAGHDFKSILKSKFCESFLDGQKLRE